MEKNKIQCEETKILKNNVNWSAIQIDFCSCSQFKLVSHQKHKVKKISKEKKSNECFSML